MKMPNAPSGLKLFDFVLKVTLILEGNSPAAPVITLPQFMNVSIEVFFVFASLGEVKL